MPGFRFFPFKTGLIAVAGLLLASSAAEAGRPVVRFGGPRYGGVAVGRYGGYGYARPGYYGGYGRGLGYGGYGLGYGYGGYGLGLGTGLGLGYGLGYGLGGYGYRSYGLGGFGFSGYSSGYGGYGLGTGVYGYGAPAADHGGYRSGYPSTNDGSRAPPYRAASPYGPDSQPLNPQANYPPPQQQVPQQRIPQEPPPVQRAENTAEVTVVVPEGAELWFNGAKTSQPGAQRKFVTPALTPGEDFTYALKARWIQDGRPVEQTRSIHVQANSSQVIDFTK